MTRETTTLIKRDVPDIGYLDRSIFTDMGFVQTVCAGDAIYISGIAPLTDATGTLEVVAGDFETQLRYVLDILDRSLQSVGANRCDLVAWTIYATDVGELAHSAPILREWVGVHPPTSTWIGVSSMIHPDQKLELTATATR
ncbi:RidA family protein [Gordonia sp. L191]|uniref:RidA family protein n=1 Tax=Gordonia sp. L191 TaxID=2982699 RepID=UPI0024BFC6C6|nr:RidA family protein [Gordonia sp. L191]WHU48767.1 RidA family protein [Gordonia sp. L191]